MERTVHHAGAVKAAATKTLIKSPVRKKAERNATIQLAFFPLTLGKPAQGMTVSTVSVGVPISSNLILIILHKHAQRLVSMVI